MYGLEWVQHEQFKEQVTFDILFLFSFTSWVPNTNVKIGDHMIAFQIGSSNPKIMLFDFLL